MAKVASVSAVRNTNLELEWIHLSTEFRLSGSEGTEAVLTIHWDSKKCQKERRVRPRAWFLGTSLPPRALGMGQLSLEFL